jgi:penicillin-binding protein 2
MAGKTGSAQVISNALKSRLGAAEKEKYKDNGWFVGVEPRRNPEIVVAALFEEGEHGDRTAHIVADVIKAFVEKQRRLPTKVAGSESNVEVGAVWSGGSQGKDLHGGRFTLEAKPSPAPLAAAAPGVE